MLKFWLLAPLPCLKARSNMKMVGVLLISAQAQAAAIKKPFSISLPFIPGAKAKTGQV